MGEWVQSGGEQGGRGGGRAQAAREAGGQGRARACSTPPLALSLRYTVDNTWLAPFYRAALSLFLSCSFPSLLHSSCLPHRRAHGGLGRPKIAGGPGERRGRVGASAVLRVRGHWQAAQGSSSSCSSHPSSRAWQGDSTARAAWGSRARSSAAAIRRALVQRPCGNCTSSAVVDSSAALRATVPGR